MAESSKLLVTKWRFKYLEGTQGIGLNEVKIEFSGKPLEISLSREVLGRIFNGAGTPIDGLGPVFARVQKRC